MTMTKRTNIDGKIACQGKSRDFKTQIKHSPPGSHSHNRSSSGSPLRLSPVTKGSPPMSPVSEPSHRSSPGLLAGHYAGCKFTDPPSASALPLPPQHWMQFNRSVMLPRVLPCRVINQHHDFTQQLKLLLKVQA